MRSFTFRSTKLLLEKVEGEVLSSSTSSTLDVVATGSSASQSHGSYAAPGRFEARTALHHQLWVRQVSGQETLFRFDGIEAPVLPGQRVVVVIASGPELPGKTPMLVANLTSNEDHLLSAAASFIVTVGSAWRNPAIWLSWLSVCAAVVVALGLAQSEDRGHRDLGGPLLLVCFVSAIFIWVYTRIALGRRQDAAFARMRDELGDFARSKAK